MSERLHELAGQLERASQRLGEPDLPAEEAEELVAECARLAGEAAAELAREVRAASAPPGEQETLL